MSHLAVIGVTVGVSLLVYVLALDFVGYYDIESTYANFATPTKNLLLIF